MATNNYYNFTHGGTQYGGQYTATNPGAAYQTPTPFPGDANAAQYPASGTESYVIQGYTRPATQQQWPGQAAYATSAPAMGSHMIHKITGSAPLQIRPAATSTVYPTYSANTTGTTTSASYAGFTPPQAQPTPGTKSFTNYDAAVYNAVASYAQGGSLGRGGGGGGGGFKKGLKPKGMRPPPKPQTLHYCDVCKISCAGPQTYKEHLDGQKHKKKEAAQKSGVLSVPKSGPAGLRCELCDVTCTGSDAYAAHIRGAKHQKVVKLHTKLGKPIPSDSPTVVVAAASNLNNLNTMKTTPIQGTVAAATGNTLMKPPPAPAPKITFAAASNNKPDVAPPGTSDADAKPSEDSPDPAPLAQPMSTTYTTPAAPGGNLAILPERQSGNGVVEYVEKDVLPVGQDYIEEIRNEEGKVTSFNCKLCECRFNDPNAKEMHMKGRRHRLQYKKKVNPDLIVDIKPSSRQKKIDDRRARTMGMRKPMNADLYGRGPGPLMPPNGRGFGIAPGYGPGPCFVPPIVRRPETVEDRHVMAKHTEVYPEEQELQAIQKIVSNTEKALKFVSDKFAEEDARLSQAEAEGEAPPLSETDLQNARKLKGVMRVGNLAKGLLLKGDRIVELVVLCSEKPTISMLDRILGRLPEQMGVVAPEEKYEFHKAVEIASIKVIATDEPKIEVIVTLTSPLLRANGAEAPGEAEATQVPEPHDLLDKEKCLDALAALRHAKWFQARATTLQSCVIVIRVLRDLSRRVSEFQGITQWTLELLAEKAINTAGMPISPGEAFRILFEVLASGFVLETGPGILDPCEKEACDALFGLSTQVREDVTAYAQQSIRQIAFRQMHQVLGMEPLPRFNKSAAFGNRKRRRDPSGNQENDETEAGNDLKKDKKEEPEGTESIAKTEPMS